MSIGIGIGTHLNMGGGVGMPTLPVVGTAAAIWYRFNGIAAGQTTAYGIADGSGNISQVIDLTGNGRHATQATGILQPLLVSGVAGTNLRKVGRSNGSQLMAIGALPLLNNVAGVTIFMVGKINTGGTLTIPVYFSTGTAAGSSRADIRTETTNVWSAKGRRLDADGIDGISGGSSTAAFKVVTGKNDYANAIAYIYENGALTGTDNPFLTAGNTSATNSLAAWLFGPAGNICIGDIAEVIVYNSALSEANILTVQSYLNTFYGIY